MAIWTEAQAEAAEKMQITHLLISPYLSLHLPISPYISPHLPLYLPASPCISQVEAAEKWQLMQWINAFQVGGR